MNESALAAFIKSAERFGIRVDARQAAMFGAFCDLLLERGATHNLTAIKDEFDVAAKHFADSLSIVPYVPELADCYANRAAANMSADDTSESANTDGANANETNANESANTNDTNTKENVRENALRILDVGTGAGFPGIPLKILLGGAAQVTMLDSVGKKTRFVQEAIELLKLSGCEAVHARVEDAAQNPAHRERYNVVAARALAPLPTLLEWCLPFVGTGGAFVAMKGRRESFDAELEKSANALRLLGGRLERVETLTVAAASQVSPASPASSANAAAASSNESMERTIAVFRKHVLTPKKYPRKPGAASAQPL